MSRGSDNTLRPLPPEPWGRRMRRAREDVAGLKLEEATARMARYLIVSTATISRLESLAEIPSDPRQLRTAFVACLAYGVDPAEVGLSPKGSPVFESLPGTVQAALRRKFFAPSTKGATASRARRAPSTRWLTRWDRISKEAA